MQKVTFKQYHRFVEAPDNLTEEQLSEIFGKFFGSNADKMKELQAKKDELKRRADAKKKEIDKAKDAVWAAAKKKIETPSATPAAAPAKTPSLMSKSTSQMRAGERRAVDRDPYGLTFEGKMDEINAELEALWPQLKSGGVELYDIMARKDKTDLSKEARKYLQYKFDGLSQSLRLHPDDDMEEILDHMMDDLEKNYG